MRTSRAAGGLLLLCGALGACDGSSGNKAAGRDAGELALDSGSTPEQTTLKGRVFDADTGRGLAEAELKSGGDASVKSDAKGNFELEAGMKSGSLKVSRPSYAPSSKEAPQQGGYVEVFLKDVDKTVDFNGEDGVSVKLASGASVALPAGAVRDAEGKSVTGPLTLDLTEIDGHQRMQASALPGEMKARAADGKEGLAAVYSALEIRIRDAKGTDLTVGADDKVTADLPVRERDAPPERKVFSYDEKSGAWVEEGKAKLVTEGDKSVYRAEIKHLSWWSSADFVSELTCLRACVETAEGKPVPGAQIWVVGASRPGVASLFAGSDGCAAGDIGAGSQVVLVAQGAGGTSEAKVHSATSEIHRVKDGVGACQDAGTLVLAAAPEAACARGFAECGDVCSELATDAAHCGSCTTACEGTDQCLAGACEGPVRIDDAGMTGEPDAGPSDGSVVASGEPIAWYRFEEASGTVVDSSGNGLDGTPSLSGITQGSKGKIGNGVTFSGGEIVVAADPLLDFTTAGTIEFWINLSETQSIGSMVSRGTGNSDDNVLVNTSCGNVQAIFSRTAAPSGTTASGSKCNLLTAGAWHHVAVVNDGTNLYVYADGVLAETLAGGYLGPIANDLWIGKRENPIFPLSGSLDELKWWNVARSQAEVCSDAEGSWDGKVCTLR